MKKFLLAALGALSAPVLLFAPLGSASETGDLFERANAGYKSRDFKNAGALYEKLIASGTKTPAVYYNLGNAEFRLGRKGAALVHYERALKTAPRDRDLRWNIRVLKSILPDRLEEWPDDPLRSKLGEILGWVAIDEISAAVLAILAMTAMLALFHWVWPASKPWTGWLGPMLWAALLTSAAIFSLKAFDAKDPRLVVLDKEVYARYGPSDKETKAFLLHEGAEARLLDETQDWFYAALPNKNTGWVPKKSCEII